MSRWARGEQVAARFVVDGRLAAGGMAEVYVADMALARDMRKKVALKRIHSHLVDDPQFVEMFIDEARLASQLRHPGVIPVLDAVEHAGDLLLVLDYVPGWDLGAVLQAAKQAGQPVPFPVALQVAVDLLSTLHYVHQARDEAGRPLRIVHRDVTPSNVLVANDRSLRLLDFGVAKAAQKVVKTATGVLKGKFAYMSPEQARGARVDHRADLYSFGLVVFEMLTGVRAIRAENELGLLQAALNPNHVAPSELRAGVPEGFDAFVGALLQIDPLARPASAGDALQLLASLQRSMPTEPDLVRRFVVEVLRSDHRPVDDGRSQLDRALALAAGLEDFGGPKTGLKPDRHGERGTGVDSGEGRSAVFSAPRSLITGATLDATPIQETRASVADSSTAVSLGVPASAGKATSQGPPGPSSTAPTVAATPLEIDIDVPVDAPSAVPSPEPPGGGGLDSERRAGRAGFHWVGVLALLALASGLVFAWQNDWFAGATTQPASNGPVDDPSEDRPVAGVAFLRVASVPPEAQVYIDGEEHPVPTPTVVEVSAGEAHLVRIEKADYEPEERSVEGEVAERIQLDVPLQRLQGTLVVTSRPSGATVYLNDDPRGETPLTLTDLPREPAELRVAGEGTASYRTTVPLDTEARVEVEANLPRRVARGMLLVNSPTQMAVLTVDGREVARHLPYRSEVAAGRHRLRLSDGMRSTTRTVQVREGQQTRVALVLE
ncbi:MAG: serine/threonine-protein kinase [Myxococcota bacterium]